MPPNISDTFIILKPRREWPNRSLRKAELMERIEGQLENLIGSNYEFTQPIEMRFNELISGVRSDVAVKIYGEDLAALAAAGDGLADILRDIRGAEDVQVGVAVLNGLVVMSSILKRFDAGIALEDAIHEAMVERFRAVIMTGIVPAIGFIPMAIATGVGAEVQKPLATVVIGGLVTATLLTLFVLPAIARLMLRRPAPDGMSYPNAVPAE